MNLNRSEECRVCRGTGITVYHAVDHKWTHITCPGCGGTQDSSGARGILAQLDTRLKYRQGLSRQA